MSVPLPWQRTHWARLAQARAAGRLAHAWLIAGPGGLGKRAFAQAFAAALLCSVPGGDGTACGVCHGCRTRAAGSHPDLRHLTVEDGRTQIRIEQTRELVEFLGYTSQFGGYRVALIEPAERMNIHTANSLLKTLEEPPPHGVLILVTERPAHLPVTVRSRCQMLAFTAPAPEEALPWVAEQAGGADAALLLALAVGAPLRALALRDALERRRVLFEGFVELARGRADPVAIAEAWQGGDLAEALGWLAGWHADMIRLTMTAQPPRLSNPDLAATLRRLAMTVPAPFLFERLDASLRVRELLVTTQPNVLLLLEDFFIDWAGAAASVASRGA